jgi:hypothetical protein
MSDFTVHLKGSPDDLAALERSVFVREGFSMAALVFGPLWVLSTRLWLALVVWLALGAGLFAWALLASPAPLAVAGLVFLMHVVLAFEAAPLRRAGLGRRGYQMVTVVHGRRQLDAERAFFARWASMNHSRSPSPSPAVGRPRQTGMVGLFPSAGS